MKFAELNTSWDWMKGPSTHRMFMKEFRTTAIISHRSVITTTVNQEHEKNESVFWFYSIRRTYREYRIGYSSCVAWQQSIHVRVVCGPVNEATDVRIIQNQTIAFRCSISLKEQLQLIAMATDVHMSQVIRRACAELVIKAQQKADHGFWQYLRRNLNFTRYVHLLPSKSWIDCREWSALKRR